jgi:hypothetical protein
VEDYILSIGRVLPAGDEQVRSTSLFGVELLQDWAPLVHLARQIVCSLAKKWWAHRPATVSYPDATRDWSIRQEIKYPVTNQDAGKCDEGLNCERKSEEAGDW